ncbi:hypothetical protein HK098_001653 [Nowakowskiella sp. JEL0407]|nr:hypothetical protein HK098_001653 [Nowakowskiella sp. JEL0407]
MKCFQDYQALIRTTKDRSDSHLLNFCTVYKTAGSNQKYPQPFLNNLSHCGGVIPAFDMSDVSLAFLSISDLKRKAAAHKFTNELRRWGTKYN